MSCNFCAAHSSLIIESMSNISFTNDILPLKDKLFRLALRVSQNREEAEDIVQDILIKLWSQRDQWHKIQNIETYSMTMCRNLALDRMGKKEYQNIPFDPTMHDRPDTTWQPDEALAQRQQLDTIDTIIASLPEKQRTVIQLRDIEGKSYQEIADVMQIGISDVKVNLFRARGKLKDKLSEMVNGKC